MPFIAPASRAAAVAVVAVLLIVSALPPATTVGTPAPVHPLPGASVASLPTASRPASPIPTSQPIDGRLFDSSSGLPVGASNSVTGIAIDPATGDVFAANEFAGSVTEFDESNGTLTDAVPVGVFAEGTFPAGLALDPSSQHLFVSISTAYTGARASGWLLVLNETGLGPVANISFASAPVTPFEPTYLAYDAPTHQLFVENQSWGYLAIVNVVTDTVTGYLTCPVAECAYHGYGLLNVPQYHTLVIPTCARQLWFVNTSNDSTRALVTGPPNALMAWAAFDATDNALWVENYTFNGASGSFFRLNLSTLAIAATVPGAPPRGTDLSYDPSGNVLVATNVNGSLAIDTYYASNGTAIASYSQGVAGSHPFYTVAIDPITGIAIGAGLGDGSTVAFSLPSLAVEEVYPSIPSSQPAVAVDAASSTYFVAGDLPPTVRAVSETSGAVLWTASFPEGLPSSSLVALADDPARNTVFAADAGLHQVRSLNATTGALQLSGAPPGGPTQCALLLDPSNGDLLVGTTAPSQLLELNPATLTVAATLPMAGDSPCALGVDPVSGDVVVLSTSGTANVTLVDPSTLEAGATWAVGAGATALAVNATGVAFVLEGGTVVAVTLSNGTRSTPAGPALGAPAATLASDNADGFLFLGLASAPSIVVVSTASGSVVGALGPTGPAGCLAFDPSSGTLIAPIAASGSVFTSTLVPVPGAPGALVAEAGNGTAWLNWTAPTASGPYPTDGYVVAARALSGPGGAPRQSVTTPTAVVGGLTDGVEYQFEVFARSEAGLGLDAALANATPLGLPYPPAAVLMVATGPTSAVLEWAAPSSDGGTPVTGYSVQYGPVGGTPSTLSAGNVTNATLTGLSPSTEYEAWVTATNSVGTGHPSVAALAATPAPVPASPASGPSAPFLALAGIAIAAAAVVGVVLGRWSRGPPPEPRTPPVTEP